MPTLLHIGLGLPLHLTDILKRPQFLIRQALMALTRPGEAAEAFRAGAVLEPKSKLWTPLVEKAQKAASEVPAKPTNGASSTNSTSTSGTASSPSTTTTTTTTTTKKVSENTSSTAKASSSSSSSGDTGPGMKGYKKTADGRLTTYFNNDLTEEAKALIGDIAPKKLEPAAAAAVPGAETAGGNAASAWNKAGTWESRDMTRLVLCHLPWCLRSLVEACVLAGHKNARRTK